MSIRSGSANGASRLSARTAPGGQRPRALDRNSVGGGSATQLPSLGVSGSALSRPGAKPPGLPLASSTAFNSRRMGDLNAKDDKNTTVITIDDLQRLREQCGLNGARSEMELDREQREQDRADLKQRSRVRVQNWPNTIENLRSKRIEDRYKKLEEEELERRRIDEEEDVYNQQKRMQAIEMANKKMHDQQDKVKAFHTKMVLCDVLQERDAQVDLKMRRKEHDRQVEEGWVENDKLKMDDYDRKMHERLEEMYKRKQETAKVIKDQLYQSKVKHIKQYKEQVLEGDLVKRKALEDLEKDRVKELERKAKQARTREELDLANRELKAYKEELKKKDEEDHKRQDDYAHKKERLDQIKKDREEQRFREKQQIREKMIQKQAEYLSQLQNKEEQILNKQVAEAEEKARRIFEEKEARRVQLKQAIQKSRKHQIEKKKQDKNAELQEEKDYSEFWKARNDELLASEELEKEEIRMKQSHLKQYQRNQTENRKKAAEDEYIRELHEAASNTALLDNKEKEFYSYAEKCIKEWQDVGKNVRPLILELKNYKKRAF